MAVRAEARERPLVETEAGVGKFQGVPFSPICQTHYFCSGPISVDSICPQPTGAGPATGRCGLRPGRPKAGVAGQATLSGIAYDTCNMYICRYTYIYIYIYTGPLLPDLNLDMWARLKNSVVTRWCRCAVFRAASNISDGGRRTQVT